MPPYSTKPITNLPSPEQLANYRVLTSQLLDAPETVRAEEKLAFLGVLGRLEPFLLSGDEVEIFEHIFPVEWRCYGELHWGALDHA